jgi:hypothetical protein
VAFFIILAAPTGEAGKYLLAAQLCIAAAIEVKQKGARNAVGSRS